jgi:NDP-4-keto-2,6-dideoxyhexose 3-C-methyltransferase
MTTTVHRRIDRCRVCGNAHLETLLDLGEQALTGVFPGRIDQHVSSGPLALVKCHGPGACGLVQLLDSYAPEEMYGDNYGYRSGVNASMVSHLRGKVERILARVAAPPGALVLDIGSNDGTTLSAYPDGRFARIGIDPTAAKFRHHYPRDVTLVCDLFSERVFRAAVGGRQAAVVTSFAMFYDLEDPLAFMRELHRVLADDGVWVFEQSYLPLMLERNAYDTICHEHVEYYAMSQIAWMAARTGFKIIDVERNDINGGSFSVAVAKATSAHPETPELARLLAQERAAGIEGLDVYRAFARRVADSRDALRGFVADARAAGKVVGALGASTKGNVVLQYCGFTADDVVAIGEVNEEKFGAFTPGTLIPICPEAELIARAPDYLIVLPWHFRDTFLRKREQFDRATRLVFPLPTLEVV